MRLFRPFGVTDNVVFRSFLTQWATHLDRTVSGIRVIFDFDGEVHVAGRFMVGDCFIDVDADDAADVDDDRFR